MIAVLRARHRAIWLLLAVVLPLLLLLAWRARQAPRLNPELPPGVESFPDDTRAAGRP